MVGGGQPQRRPVWWGKGEAERGGRAQVRWYLVGFGAELRPLARHSLEAGLDAGDWAARVARFTLQEIEASVLLQDGLWGSASVTRHVFLCKGGKKKTSISMTLFHKHTRDHQGSHRNELTPGLFTYVHSTMLKQGVSATLKKQTHSFLSNPLVWVFTV